MSNIVVTVDQPPSGMVSEKLRMAVGLTLLDENSVTVLLLDDGVYTGLGIDREKSRLEIDKHLETLSMMGAKLLASASSARKRGVEYKKFGIGMLSDEELSTLLKESQTNII